MSIRLPECNRLAIECSRAGNYGLMALVNNSRSDNLDVVTCAET
jgi:hypothetical protein